MVRSQNDLFADYHSGGGITNKAESFGFGVSSKQGRSRLGSALFTFGQEVHPLFAWLFHLGFGAFGLIFEIPANYAVQGSFFVRRNFHLGL